MTSRILEPIHDLDQFRAAPVGRLYVGPSFVLWCAAPELVGAIQWDAIDDDTVHDTETILAFVCRPDRAALLDWQCIERVDGETLLGIVARARSAELGLADRHVVVLPLGLPRVLLAGGVLSLAPVTSRFAETREHAVEVVNHPLAAAAAASAIEHAAEARSGSAVLVRLRDVLRRNLSRATVGSCAFQLGLSARTLQRVLEGNRTTFTSELRRARMTAAIEMLESTDLRVDLVAARAGFGTSSRLSASLQRERHVTPGELRARTRRSRVIDVASGELAVPASFPTRSAA